MKRITIGDAISKAEFHGALRHWFDKTEESTIGDADFGKTAWLHIAHNGETYRLNADTHRKGVQEYLGLVDQFGDDLAWTIRPNQNGRENAVGYGPDCKVLRYFYLYLVS